MQSDRIFKCLLFPPIFFIELEKQICEEDKKEDGVLDGSGRERVPESRTKDRGSFAMEEMLDFGHNIME